MRLQKVKHKNIERLNMNKYIKSVVTPLAAIGLAGAIINPVFADLPAQYSMDTGHECYRGFSSMGELPVRVPVGCTIALFDENITNVSIDDDNILELKESQEGEYALTAKKSGSTEVVFHNSGEGSAGVLLTAIDVKSDTPWIVNSAVKQYLIDNYGSDKDIDNYCYQHVGNCYDKVNLDIDDVSVDDLSDDEKSKIEEALDGGTILAYKNIELVIESDNGDEIERITGLGSGCGENAAGETACVEMAIEIRLAGLNLGKPAEGYERNFYAIRLHDGSTTKIAAEVDEDENLVFPSGKFSTYAIAYKDVEASSETDESDTTGSETAAPDTGANTQDENKITVSSLGYVASGIILVFTLMPKIRKYLKA